MFNMQVGTKIIIKPDYAIHFYCVSFKGVTNDFIYTLYFCCASFFTCIRAV